MQKWMKASPIFHMFHLLEKYGLCNVFDNYVQTGCFMTKKVWSRTVNNALTVYYNGVVDSQLSTRLSLYRYADIRSNTVHNLWKLLLDKPVHFQNIATLIRYGVSEITSRECSCGVVAHDIVKHVFMSCTYIR